MTLMRFHLIHLIENTFFYVWHDCGNRGIQNARKMQSTDYHKERTTMYKIKCPWCSVLIDYDYAEYYGILKTRNIVYRCPYCKAQFSKRGK
jgi:hypothetical protein